MPCVGKPEQFVFSPMSETTTEGLRAVRTKLLFFTLFSVFDSRVEEKLGLFLVVCWKET